MIKGMHGMFYSSDAAALRAFIRDKLGLPYTDVGDGWLIFDVPLADLGCHPTDFPGSPRAGAHSLSFWCDDLERTVRELRERGVAFTDEISDRGYGLTIHFDMPGGVHVELYQPKYSKQGDRS